MDEKPDLDKRNMLENFMRYVPDFPMKAFAQQTIYAIT